MPLTDQERIALDARHPRIVDLWFALQPLRSVLRFMQSGAHPDDETSAMLAALAYREGFAISYACAVRGEGGQNDIGTEVTEDLGVLRTAEMERAADVLDMNLYWLSETPDDTIFDFGFSKSGVETLGRWNHDRVLRRFVEIVRTERPDILCPTFLDIPGQHGHHRAMTAAAQEVFAAAADPDFPINLPVWEIKKLYLPAWSGAGGSYDDEVPPPPATLTVDMSDGDPLTGWNWERIGQQSRAYHRSQGMGRWAPAGSGTDRPLHLAMTRCDGADQRLQDGLRATLADYCGNSGPAAEPLLSAAKAIERALEAFPDFPTVLVAAADALTQVRAARAACPDKLRADLLHRLDRKEAELARVIRLAAGVDVAGHVPEDWLHPGTLTPLTVERTSGLADELDVAIDLPAGWVEKNGEIGPGEDAPASDPYPSAHQPLQPSAPALAVTVTSRGVVSTSHVALVQAPVALPSRTARLTPESLVLNTATKARGFEISVQDVAPAGANVDLGLPDKWQANQQGNQWQITAPSDLEDGLFVLPLTLDGIPAENVHRIAYPHVAPRARCTPTQVAVRAVNARLSPGRVGYIGGGNDRVGYWLAAMGADLHDISDEDLANPESLAGFDSIVIGIFAMRFRDGLIEAMPHIHNWIAGGGHLLTLYHRPWDRWDPDSVPPKWLEIGQPSLRWRVTDEAAEVTHLSDTHVLLNDPNRIGPEDWQGWHKERGLYFAKSWDPAYEPLIEMADPGEAPHRGSLLSAKIGKGRHTHCALILHHQLEKLTPGAFRLLANLVAPAA